MYCCPNNFRRAAGRLPEYVFYAKENSISANLYTECTATLDIGTTKVGIREETDYPKSGKVKFTFSLWNMLSKFSTLDSEALFCVLFSFFFFAI